MDCDRCGERLSPKRLFCKCGRLVDRAGLRKVRLLGPIGVAHSNSPKIEQFWETGDPTVFDQP